MIKPDWNKFKAKFSDNPQDNFEWLCYLLFCKEFDKIVGIFRYKNQSSIETNPIQRDNDIIGWQSKFYDTTLSNHKGDLLNTIDKAKRDYPNITKLFFYTNQEWGQGRDENDSKAKIEIEEKARELNIEVEWRTASYFESEFVSIENDVIAKHFFTLDKSIFDLIEDQKKHSQNILKDIQTSIDFKGQTIEINRNEVYKQLQNKSQKVFIVSGVGGVGKTAVVKNLYERIQESTPFYIFKATEFELRHINDFFIDFTFQDFIKAHKDENSKLIVIDSAEKLLDIKNTNPFEEILSTFITNKWKIIFTTRENYLEDLNYQFSQIYNIAPLNINIQKLERDNLNSISEEYNFSLPQDEKLLELIKNPFYLNEYLKSYNNNDELDYSSFKNKLWNRNIKKSKPAREQCFLRIAFKRANEGQFFIIPNCDSRILDDELVNDGILGYETAGYFITHDIYEEWALEKIIETEFIKRIDEKNFFEEIGQALPIRRSFRNWLSEKLLLENEQIKIFIEDVLEDSDIQSFWKDEILVSVLLSSYSESFFNIFEKELLINNQELLKRLTFLLRIACKEVDEDFFKQLGVKNLNVFSLEYTPTKPKGQGWESLIKFIYENLGKIGIENINFVLPIIYDWNNKFKKGETTKFASLIALKYYNWHIENDVYFSRDNSKENILKTIVYGASEIRDELKIILEEVVKNNWKNHRDPYYDLSKFILTKIEAVRVSEVIPKRVLQLADLFWSYTSPENTFYPSSRLGIEEEFNIEDDYGDYSPSSSYQTPIYWLLKFSLQETVDFILEFTSKTVESYAKSDLGNREVEEIKVFIDENQTIKQYISNRLWCTYRGTQGSPHVLESIHMALEKFFLEGGKYIDSKVLQDWFFYLLKNSKSASISAIVTSIVLAYPEKTFNVAKILFQTKEFFRYETKRLVLDQGQKSSLLMLKNYFSINSKDELHENERIKACDDKHRNLTLEHLFLRYQCFRDEETSEKDAEKRQKILWEILDEYYKELPDESDETELDKTWKLYLARMDRRKMNPTTEKTDDGIIINWNPEIESKLKEHSDKSLQKSSEHNKYNSLNLWVNYKIKNDDQYKEYNKYEENPKIALKEVNEIIDNLQKKEDENFYSFISSIPAKVCSVLLRDYFEELSREEKDFCKNIVLEVASFPFIEGYYYQVSDGTKSTISVLPVLLEQFPEEKETIKVLLLLSLFKRESVNMAHTEFNIFSINAIHKLWENYFNDAQSLLFGYLLLKPKYDELIIKLREENYKKGVFEVPHNQIIEKLVKENELDFQKIVDCELSLDDLREVEELNLYTLKIVFQLIPLKTDNKEHKEIVKKIISVFAKNLLSKDRDDKVDYGVEHDFLKKLAYFVLSSKPEQIEEYLKPFLDNFNNSESIADLLKEFILAEDRLDTYDNFWKVWGLFEEKVVEICKDECQYWYVDKIVKSYLFAQVSWKDTATSWHTLKNTNKRFFKEISRKIGHCPSTLYSISKLLNDIGSFYLNEGIFWTLDILSNNKNLLNEKLETNTIYYLGPMSISWTQKFEQIN